MRRLIFISLFILPVVLAGAVVGVVAGSGGAASSKSVRGWRAGSPRS